MCSYETHLSNPVECPDIPHRTDHYQGSEGLSAGTKLPHAVAACARTASTMDSMDIDESVQVDYTLTRTVGDRLYQMLDIDCHLDGTMGDEIFETISPGGTTIKVYRECVEGICTCTYYVGSVRNQLKPCRLASMLYVFGEDWLGKFENLLWNVTDGFPIVDAW